MRGRVSCGREGEGGRGYVRGFLSWGVFWGFEGLGFFWGAVGNIRVMDEWIDGWMDCGRGD